MDSTFLQKVHTVQVVSSGALGSQTSSGVFIGIRIFDMAFCNTNTSLSNSARAHNILADGTTNNIPVIGMRNVISSVSPFITSTVGWKFPYGVWIQTFGGAGSVSVNYIEEVS